MNLGSRFHISKRASIPWYLAWAIRLGAIVIAMIVCALVTPLPTGVETPGVTISSVPMMCSARVLGARRSAQKKPPFR